MARVWIVAACAHLMFCVSSSQYLERCEDYDQVPLETSAGLVCGRVRVAGAKRYASFRGVPYVRQPVGQWRFADLPPPEPWSGFLDASEEGPVCPQHDLFYKDFMEPHSVGEDCLHVNIHVPLSPNQVQYVAEPERTLLPPIATSFGDKRSRKPRGMPIFVFIHGGGFAFGSGDSDFYGPEYLVDKGVIVITFNYRLGPFGFLSLNSSAVPGNAGLRDQVSLLRWVNENARAFGGDPEDVTIGGQSAGGASVHLLTLSEAAVGLFQKAITMSGNAARSFFSSSPIYESMITQAFLTQLGINATDPDLIHQALIDTPLIEIMRVSKLLQDQGGIGAFYPVVESSFPGIATIIDKDPEVLIAEGRGKNIPLIIGFTPAECASFVNVFQDVNITERIKASPALTIPPSLIFTTPPEQLQDKILQVASKYFVNSSGYSSIDNFVQFCTDAYFVYPAMFAAKRRAEVGGAPVYLYQFSYQGQYRVLNRPGINLVEPGHVEDLTYLFKINSKPAVPEELLAKSQDRLMQHWMSVKFTDFMRSGNPGGSDVRYWPPATTQLCYQDIRGPWQRHVTPPTPQQEDMVRFFNDLYTTKV